MEEIEPYDEQPESYVHQEILGDDYETSAVACRTEMSVVRATPRKIPQPEFDIAVVKENWFRYRAYFIPLSKMFEWETPHYPASALAAVSLTFLVILLTEPSVLTAGSILLIIISVLDYAADSVSDKFFPSDTWGDEEDQQFEVVCSRTASVKSLFSNTYSTLANMRIDKPSVYIVIIVGLLLVLAWIGSVMDNLFMLYIVVVLIFLLPGLRRYEVPKLIMDKIANVVRNLRNKLDDSKEQEEDHKTK